jgi:hypothetical protein
MFFSKKNLIIIILILFVVNILTLIFFEQIKNTALNFFQGKKIYYAVYLNNGQIFIGQIEKIKEDELVLKDAYFLDVFKPENKNNNLENSTSTNNHFKIQSQNQLIYNLAKWSNNELLKNDGVLFINRDAILFWEKLSSESEVVKQILKIK